MIKKNYVALMLFFGTMMVIFWMVQKPLFLVYNWNHGGTVCTFHDVIQIYAHGLRLDLASAAYLTAIPALLVGLQAFFPSFPLRKVWLGYNTIIAVLLALVTLADASLYEFWEFKLDSTVFMYIDDPKNAFASVSIGYILLRALGWIVLSAVFFFLMWPRVSSSRCRVEGWRQLAGGLSGFVLTCGLLFACIRGLSLWPNNPGAAFYSKTLFHNHVALNPVFNMIYSSTRNQDFDSQFNYFDEAQREKIIEPLFPTQGMTQRQLLNTSRPNILVVVLEGMGACFIESLGGEKDVAPNLSRICASESVNFTQAYCSSFRTDRGIVATLSGYPAQPTTSIMRYSNKIQKLPALPEVLRRQGYHTQALYPSDASFFNMSNYFLCAGHDRLVTEDDFPAKQRSAQWGVPDHIGFDWLLRDLQEKAKDKNGRYYTTYLTISSHTPFDVPYHRLDDVKLNGFAYTDSCFGDFIDRLRPTEAWENLLIVCTADHGFNYREIASPDFAHVPFFLMGGAVKETMALDVIVSQTDLPALILGQLGLPHDEFVFSRDVLADTYTDPCAFSTFNNGFTIFDTTGCTVFDNNAASAIYGDDERRINRGKAFLQTLYDDLAKR